MPKLAVGDKVQIIEHSNDKHRGRRGEVIRVGSGFKIVSQPVDVDLPKQELEPRYSITLESGKTLHSLREEQLRKL